MRALALFALFACALAGGCNRGASAGGTEPGTREHKARTVSVFVTTELSGTIEPCGCNSDPRGDIARAAAVIKKARAEGDILYIDGGSLLFSDTRIPEHRVSQATLTAKLIRQAVKAELGAAAIGLGPRDLALGPEAVTIPRHAANVSAKAGIPLAPPQVITAGDVRVGIFGVVNLDTLLQLKIPAIDPAKAAAQAVKKLRDEGAEVIIALAHMSPSQAKKLAQATPGIDFVVAGQNAPDPDDLDPAPERAGDTWIIQPVNRGQGLARLDLTIRPGKEPFADAIGQARARAAIAGLSARIDDVRTRIAGWEKDPTADPAFLKAKKQELQKLEEERAALEASPLNIPEHGSYFVLSHVPVSRRLPCDPEVQAAKIALNSQVGKANLQSAKDRKPQPVSPGQPDYVGIEECSFCHAEAVAFWKNTLHAKAWETLEHLGKEFSYDCIGCHVTGWQAPGGSTLAFTDGLRDVQCEVCHGPGSLHVAKNGKAPLTVKPPESTCKTCHNDEHSDTFQYEAYLRDVTGPGHGEAFRKTLGPGPTGHALRAAKEITDIGEGCVK